MGLKNQNPKKEREKSLKQKSEKNLTINSQKNKNKIDEKEKPKTITTKKIDLSGLKYKNIVNNKI